MENIDESTRKPRRLRGTPSYKYRNRFACAVIAAGIAVAALLCQIPQFNAGNEKILKEFEKYRVKEIERRDLINSFWNPQTSRGIQETIDEGKLHKSEV